MTAVFAQLHLRFVQGDLNEPGAKFCFVAKTRNVLEGFKDSLLRYFFCISVILQQRQCRKKYRSLVGAHKVIEGFHLACLDSADQNALSRSNFGHDSIERILVSMVNLYR